MNKPLLLRGLVAAISGSTETTIEETDATKSTKGATSYGKTINYAGGVKNMTHRIFYGTDFKLTDSDKKMFSRGGDECKDLLQGRAGLPVVVSQKQDKDFPIWKVQYGVSCLVFPTYEDAMDFCRDRFTRLDGKAV